MNADHDPTQQEISEQGLREKREILRQVNHEGHPGCLLPIAFLLIAGVFLLGLWHLGEILFSHLHR